MSEVYFDIETTGLFPEKARVTCIGLMHSDFGVRVFSGQDELKLLTEATEFLYDCGDDSVLVSFNGLKFDVPFLLKRLELLKASSFEVHYFGGDSVNPSFSSVWSSFSGSSLKHVDLMIVLSAKYEEVMCQKLSTGRLSKNQARDWFDIYEPRAGGAVHGVMVAKTQSDWSPVWLHNSLDLFTTKRLFDEAKKRGWV